MSFNSPCLGCKLANKIEPTHVVYENTFITCILDIEPFNEGHMLILPKNHFVEVEELDQVTADSIMQASMKLSKVIKHLFEPDGISICQNGGQFNDLDHYHMHLIPRFHGQLFYNEEVVDNSIVKSKLGETKSKVIQQLKL